MLEEAMREIVALYRMKNQVERPLIVGVDGFGGSGKTTLALLLSDQLKEAGIDVLNVFHMDDFIVEAKKRYDTGFDEWYEYYYLQWDVELIKNTLFKPLHQQTSSITVPFYDKVNDAIYEMNQNIRTHSVILCEGIFLQRDEWRYYFDYVVFIDCPQKIRYERIINRDGESQELLNKYERRYWKAEKYYLSNKSPIERANKVLSCIKKS
ncbi:kinase [Bacillus horti]|uniref:Uridine kinase n=1 Tax=Caldalkalibacillus horti TaxID=77523 RepID=A0ABT9W0J9_9BACI|nr:kinase [Bacillus horti]MDQ0166779.1 uridine kinase [Bacillus horti]